MTVTAPGVEAGPDGSPAAAGQGVTSTSPTGRQLWRAARLPVAAGLLVLLAAGVAAVVNSGTDRGELTVGGVSPGGGRALATLLRERGVEVVRARSVEAARAAAGRGDTVFVPAAPLVAPQRLAELRGTGADLVLVAADAAQLRALGVDDVAVGGRTEVRSRRPSCPLPAARRAGSAELGGQTYRAVGDAAGVLSCYPAGDGAALVVTNRTAGPRVTLVGAPDLFTNDRLDDDGDAALALNLLGAHPRLVWLEPVLAPEPTAAGSRSILALLPGWVRWGSAGLALAVVVIAVARARRLGPVVHEPLPVVVRSAEVVEGRARLYRAGRARGQAAEALRDASRSRLRALLGVTDGPADPAGPLVEALVRRTGRSADRTALLLFGPPPPDDAALVRLAADLDALETEVRRP